MANRKIATDGNVENDNYIKNDSECCVFVPTPESPITVVPGECVTGCETEPTNGCGLTHPEGSGTLAGCKSTTLPHFGVILSKRDDTCRRFGYYTSGNTEEYEGICGDIQKLTHEVVTEPCVTNINYKTEPCDCFGNQDTGEKNKAAADKNKADIATNKTAIAKNTADIAANHP